MEGLLSGVNDAIMASWRSGTKAPYNRPVQRWLEYCGRPSQPRYSKMWGINKVLIYLKGLGRNEDLTLRQLTLKTDMPLSILAGRRLHTLHQLETSTMNISDTGGKVICHIIDLTKCFKPSRPNKPIVFGAYTEYKFLCPVTYIKKYLHISAGLVDRKCTQFFIKHGKPNHPRKV